MPEIIWLYTIAVLLVHPAMIVAGLMFLISMWRGMKAQEMMADSIERIEKIIECDQTGLLSRG
jgi:hypothetical protein